MKTQLKGIFDLPFADYLALSAINKSGLDQIAKSPAHYQHSLKFPEEQTDAMLLGAAAHTAILEPEKFLEQYVSAPEGMKRDERSKAYQEFLAANPGKTVLKPAEFAQVKGMANSVWSKSVAKELLTGGKAESCTIWADPETEVLCKSRIDYTRTDDILVDVKTCNSANFYAFREAVKAHRYHVQAAFYLAGINAALQTHQYKRFVLLAIEKGAPYEMIAYSFDPESLRIGWAEARQNLAVYAECLKSGNWPGYPTHLHTMTVPIYE